MTKHGGTIIILLLMERIVVYVEMRRIGQCKSGPVWNDGDTKSGNL